MTTQLTDARAKIITEAMRRVAGDEKLGADAVRDEVAAGRLVIPANRIHLQSNLRPAGIGRALRTKVNANLGTSSVRCSVQAELEKMEAALAVGADAIMDLSTGGHLDAIRAELLAHCPVPFGTVPIYQVIEGRQVEDITWDLIRQTVEKQAQQGVDFFTIHAGVLREHLPLVDKRVMGIVSRGGALLAKWMLHHNRQNPLYEMFDELCDIMVEYDVCFSLGDGLRPGAIADATDEAQLAELRTLGELTQRAQERGCQVMVEGPGHVPFHQIQRNMELQQQICRGAPFYVLGPLVTDIAPGYDHITSAIGGCAAAFYGASFLCYVTPREHLGLPNVEDVRAGVVAAKIAAHAADLARGLTGVNERDRKLSTARSNLDWEAHLATALDPQTAHRMHREACQEMGTEQLHSADYCSMCGQHWCSARINKEVRATVRAGKTED
ncbi:MAG: phosphomethylpyrimidine synthase ThiC [Planctomycetes bacterium]|jgi:phosphomethylpyrimidine synthase|nr:phosphomethylpyrimidine synthase ThiC [Planctomycetota bacterium]